MINNANIIHIDDGCKMVPVAYWTASKSYKELCSTTSATITWADANNPVTIENWKYVGMESGTISPVQNLSTLGPVGNDPNIYEWYFLGGQATRHKYGNSGFDDTWYLSGAFIYRTPYNSGNLEIQVGDARYAKGSIQITLDGNTVTFSAGPNIYFYQLRTYGYIYI